MEAGMRLAVLATVVMLVLIAVVILRTNVLAPPPADERLAGVDVTVAGYAIDDLPDERQRLTVTLAVTSERDLDECMAFALDQAFAHRRMATAEGECVRPVARQRNATLTYDGLTEDDLMFPDHSIVWGVPGGRCGLVLELVGVCVVDFAGTADIELPSRTVLPSRAPFGSFGPLIPLFSFDPE
jgi:hypothetical protein